MFDILGLLIIEPLFPGGASLKVVEFWSQYNIGAASACSSLRIVQKLLEKRILAGLCLCSSTDDDP